MGIFDIFKKKDTDKAITHERIRGRWWGMMYLIGEDNGYDMQKATKDKATEILTMLKISNEFPNEFKIVKHN